MSCKKITVIPLLFKFENSLGIKDRKVMAVFFIPNKSNNPTIHSTEAVLGQMKFFHVVCWCTDKRGYQRGSHRMRKIFDLYNKGEFDLLICNSKDDLISYESSLGSLERSILKSSIPIYCIKDCILMKDSNIISL